MQTISNRIEEIKKQLDELEGHVNSTLSILDCKHFPLLKYPEDYKKFEWLKYDSFIGWRNIYKSEEETLETLNQYKPIMDDIYYQNVPLIQKNTESFKKICDFLIKLGFSTTTYEWSGAGKRRHSYTADSQWVSHLKNQYPMVDDNYKYFISWHSKKIEEIGKYFEAKRIQEAKEREEEAIKRRAREAEDQRVLEQSQAAALASEYLLEKGLALDRDFTLMNAVDIAFKLKTQSITNPVAKEIEVERPKTLNAFDRMEI